MSDNTPNDKMPSEAKADMIALLSIMPPKKIIEHFQNLQSTAVKNAREDEREEIICQLFASGMTVDEIALILCVKKEIIILIEQNNATTKIPDYTKKYKLRLRRRERQAK